MAYYLMVLTARVLLQTALLLFVGVGVLQGNDSASGRRRGRARRASVRGSL